MTESERYLWENTYAYGLSKLRAEEADFESEMLQRMEESPARKEFYGAALEARRSAKKHGIRPYIDDHGARQLSVRQGIKAACLSREDIDTVTRTQLSLLERLDRLHVLERTTLEATSVLLKATARNRTLLWTVIWLLVYIAIKVT
jgi:hypothetical protein